MFGFKLKLPKSATGPAIAVCCFGTLGAVLISTTHLYLIEQYVCREYYSSLEPLAGGVVLVVGENGKIDESLCKEAAIQSTVATIQGAYSFLMYLPGEFVMQGCGMKLMIAALVMTGPWANVVKVIGKKSVLFLGGCSLCASSCFFTTICM